MTDATTAAADDLTTAALSESLHVLIDEPTRAAAMGLAVINAREIGPRVRPREGESIRILLESQLDAIRQRAPELYARALEAGRQELAERAAIVELRKEIEAQFAALSDRQAEIIKHAASKTPDWELSIVQSYGVQEGAARVFLRRNRDKIDDAREALMDESESALRDVG